MVKRKRREKKLRANGLDHVELPETVGDAATEQAVDRALELADISAEPVPSIDLDAEKESDILDADGTQPHKKRRKEQANLLDSGYDKIQPVQDIIQTGEEAISNTTPPKSRYILFVGNLPFNTTNSSIQDHFSALAPGFTIRHATDKATGRSRGFAFLEFENDAVMRRCLKGYHHSIFYTKPSDRPASANEAEAGDNQDGQGIHPSRLERMNSSKSRGKPSFSVKGKEAGGRRINIELTAGGGGGKSTARKEKLQAKNKKLSEERARVRETQRKLKEATERNKLRGKKKGKHGGAGG